MVYPMQYRVYHCTMLEGHVLRLEPNGQEMGAS